MDYFAITMIAFVVALDAFAVSVGTGVSLGRASVAQTLRMAGAFGLFQAMMLVLGWWAGRMAKPIISGCDHWIAFALLVLIGGKMIYESLKPPQGRKKIDPTRGYMLIVLAIATSIDALAVGLSLAMVGAAILVPAVVVGVLTAGMSALGIQIGRRLGARFSHRIEIVGGLLLIGIGVRILAQHLA